MHKTSFFLLGSLFFALTFFAGMFFAKKTNIFNACTDAQSTTSVERRESGFNYINPLLECEYSSSHGNEKLAGIKRKTESILREHPNLSVSVYYRDLSNGPWFGENEDTTFAPQSLLKLPVAISYMKMSEEDPTILQQTITYSEPIESNLEKQNDLVLGEKYPISFLIERALMLSDNIAFNLLVVNLPAERLKKTHQDLGIPYPDQNTPQNFVSVKSYSSIFRILYNSSYLYRKNSEYLLEILSRTDFTNGLTTHLPKDILVSHKFGILNKKNGEKQLHDCGIIYLPENPYILCVMSQGDDIETLEKTVQDVSLGVFEAVKEK